MSLGVVVAAAAAAVVAAAAAAAWAGWVPCGGDATENAATKDAAKRRPWAW